MPRGQRSSVRLARDTTCAMLKECVTKWEAAGWGARVAGSRKRIPLVGDADNLWLCANDTETVTEMLSDVRRTLAEWGGFALGSDLDLLFSGGWSEQVRLITASGLENLGFTGKDKSKGMRGPPSGRWLRTWWPCASPWTCGCASWTPKLGAIAGTASSYSHGIEPGRRGFAGRTGKWFVS